ncbi:M23 family metallopeptidase [Draconibacterium sp.]|nr:M23 family metallopeptidase [Draconibacterium sp.]
MKIILTILIFLSSFFVFAQERYYTDPVKIPMLLSGTFAELRSNHFHSGIDIKTQGKSGFPVYAVADGFISRIVVSPSGYGKALYIDHPNGTTSVYGHLKNFREDIEKYVKIQQYNKKSFGIDTQVLPGTFPLEKNTVIAKSGNSGSSGGPHLHFELRDTRSEHPINPLKYNFSVTDKTPPRIFSLMVVPLNDTSHVNYQTKKRTYPVVFYEGSYFIKNNPTIPVSGKIGFAIKTYDYLDGTWNKCGVNSIQLTIDDELYFSYENEEFSFEESRYINSLIDYEKYINSRNRYIKTWIDPGNQLSIYSYSKNSGVLKTIKNNVYTVRIELKDSYENKSVLKFNIKSVPKKIMHQPKPVLEVFNYNDLNNFKTDEFELIIPKGALYKDLPFTYKTRPIPHGYFSDVHIVHKNTVPLHEYAQIKVKAKNLPARLESKTVLVLIGDISGEPEHAGGEFKNGWITSRINTFGHYAVKVDTLAPTIKPLSINNSTTLNESNRIRFKIDDDLSGIKKFEVTIDGQWALFEYDPRYQLITHYFDNERFELNKRHYLKLTVTDNKKNQSLYEATFWK